MFTNMQTNAQKKYNNKNKIIQHINSEKTIKYIIY